MVDYLTAMGAVLNSGLLQVAIVGSTPAELVELL
jgi:hypothetical protein